MAAGMVFLSLGGSVSTFATSLSTTDFVSTSKQAIEQQLYIHNGDFNDGFDHGSLVAKSQIIPHCKPLMEITLL